MYKTEAAGLPAPSKVASLPLTMSIRATVDGSRANRQTKSACPFKKLRPTCKVLTPWLATTKPRTLKPLDIPSEFDASQAVTPWSINSWSRPRVGATLSSSVRLVTRPTAAGSRSMVAGSGLLKITTSGKTVTACWATAKSTNKPVSNIKNICIIVFIACFLQQYTISLIGDLFNKTSDHNLNKCSASGCKYFEVVYDNQMPSWMD